MSNPKPKSKSKKQSMKRSPHMKLPDFKSYKYKILPFKDTKKAFPNFPWRTWIPPFKKNHKHQYVDGYNCVDRVCSLCKTDFKDRATKRQLSRDAKHHKKHKGKPKDVYEKRTRFLGKEKRDKDNVLWVCYVGEIDIRPSAIEEREKDPKHWAIAGFLLPNIDGDNKLDTTNENIDEQNEIHADNSMEIDNIDSPDMYVTKSEMQKYISEQLAAQQMNKPPKQLKQQKLTLSANSFCIGTNAPQEVNDTDSHMMAFKKNGRMDQLSKTFEQLPLSKYNFELNYGLTPNQIFQHEYFRNYLIITLITDKHISDLQTGAVKMIKKKSIKFKANDVTVHCAICAEYYPCSTNSATTYCCPSHQRRNNIFIRSTELNSIDAGTKLLDELSIHCNDRTGNYHSKFESEYYKHDTINRTLTYCQVIKALTIILQNAPDNTFEIMQATDEEFGTSGNNNNSRKRMGDIRLLLDRALTFNTITYIQTPSEELLAIDLRPASLHADTYSRKPNKGEMIDMTTRTNSVRKVLILGWPKHEYGPTHTTFTDLDKARLIVKCMQENGALPTPLAGQTFIGIACLIYVMMGGDSKYVNFIKWLNIALKEIDEKLHIYKSITGEEMIDDNHVLEKGYKAAMKHDSLSKDTGKIAREASAYGNGPRCASIKTNSNMTIPFNGSPQERYATHYVKMMQPFVHNYKDVITLFQLAEWDKLDALTSAQFVLGNIVSMDWMTPGVTIATNTYQREQSYAGATYLIDKCCHEDIFPKIQRGKTNLLFALNHFMQNENLMIWKAFATSVADILPRLSHSIYIMIKNGKYDDVQIFFSEEIQNMRERNWKKWKNINHKRVYIKRESQQKNLQVNIEQFMTRLRANDEDFEVSIGEYLSDDDLFDDKFDDYVDRIMNETIDDNLFKNVQFEYKEPTELEDIDQQLNIFLQHLELTEPAFPLPLIIQKCNKSQFNRALLTAKYVLNGLDAALRYDDIYYNQLKDWPTYAEKEDGIMSLFNLDSYIDKICIQLDELKQNEVLRTQLVQNGTVKITKLYESYLNNNKNEETFFLFPVAPAVFMQQLIKVKGWMLNFLLFTNKAKQLKYDIKSIRNTMNKSQTTQMSGIELRLQFSEHKHENEYNNYIRICQKIERHTKEITIKVCSAFWIFWELQQGKCNKSSMACEPIGNITKRYASKTVGKTKDHKQIERCMKIKGRLKATSTNRSTLCRGVTHFLVDTGHGAVKSAAEINVKRQKYPNVGEVILRQNEGVSDRKYYVPMMVNSAQIRNSLHISDAPHEIIQSQMAIDEIQSVDEVEIDEIQSVEMEFMHTDEVDCIRIDDDKSASGDIILDLTSTAIHNMKESINEIEKDDILNIEQVQLRDKQSKFMEADENTFPFTQDIIIIKT
eukprot:547211_1